MKKAISFAFLVTLGAALFLTGSWYGRHSAASPGTNGERKVLYYVDPMNPAHTSSEPGQAPCGMKMEPVYGDSSLPAAGVESLPGTVSLSAEKQQLAGVRVAPASQAALTHTLRLFGRVAPDERRMHRLNAGIDGVIREVSGLVSGSRVTKDQWLASFSAPESRATIQGYLTTVGAMERQRKSAEENPAQMSALTDNIRLAGDRLQALGMSHLQVEEVRKSREAPWILRIHSPIDGFVLAQNVTPGLTFDKGQEWYRIADLERVWVLADVYAGEAEYVKPGTVARVSLPGQAKPFPARVSEALPQFDPATKALKVRLEVENPETLLRPEMLVEVALTVELPATLAVPADAVVDAGIRSVVFVDRGKGVFEPKTVKTGRRLAEQIEILEGIAAGDRIVTAGTFFLDSESRMKMAAEGRREEVRKDPVCGMAVDEPAAREAKLVTEHAGHAYLFCNEGCKKKFQEKPERFVPEGRLAQAAGNRHP